MHSSSFCSLDEIDITKGTNHIPTALFNSMINPLTPYTIKGALWYQGESNRKEPEDYKKLFPAMVKDWRSRWGIGDFPFYYVQIAPFLYGNNDVFQTVDNSAFIRETQLQCLDLIPNSGIAITMDIGDDYCIHPPKKKEVADRLLFNALNQTYGYKTVDHASPIYESLEIKDAGLVQIMSDGFASFASAETLPFMAFLSSGIVNMFVPSGGGQWVVQGPVFIEAATKLGTDHSLIVMSVAYGDQWTNMIQPFWTIPLLAIANLDMRKIMGYTFVILLVTLVTFGGGLLLLGAG